MAAVIDELRELLPKFVKNAKEARSQPAKQILFTKLLDDIFGIQPENLNMEVPVTSKVMLVRGRIDTVFGDLIIEFKVSLERELEDAHTELIKYFQAFREKYPSQKFVGIATDDLGFIVYKPKIENGVVKDIIEIDRIDLEQKMNEPEFVYLWFDAYFFVSKKVIPTSVDIRKRFGIDSPTFHSFIDELSLLYSSIGESNQVKVKLVNWQRYLEIVYGDKPKGNELFINHTYLATLAKLLVHYRITGGKPIARDDIKKIIFGDTFRKFGILNFIEEDFFTWYFQRRVYDIAIDLVFRLSKELQIYNLDVLDEDILKELYQEMVSVEVRHTLGEYYTPDWLAERVVEDLVKANPQASFLDPSCGSGTFLFSTINMVIPALKKKGFSDDKILTHILENVVGIDINPIAVIIARTNYLLALKDIVKSRKSSVRLPIYLSDAIRFPEYGLSVYNAIPRYKMPAQDKVFEIPQAVADRPSVMDSIIEKMQEHAKNYQETLEAAVKYTGDSEKLRSGIIDSFERSLTGSASDPIKTLLINDLRIMTELIDSGFDSIWAYILKNFLKPIAFSGKKFHFVIGNPPWLAMQFMMNPEYQDFLKEETLGYGLIDKKQTHLFTHMEMATLFFCKISETYLEDGGKIAFVMPRSVLTGLHHVNFINMRFAKKLMLKIETVFDAEHVTPLFKVPSCVIVATKGQKNEYPVPMLVFSGELPTTNEKWSNAKKLLQVSETTFKTQPVNMENRTPYYNRFFQGATMFPRNFWFVSFQSDPQFGFNPQLPLVISAIDNDAKLPWKNVKLEGNVEADSLYATVIGKDLVPFGYKQLRPIVMPLLMDNKKLVLMKSYEDGSRNMMPELGKYLKKAEQKWKEFAQKDSDGNLKIDSPYTRLDYPQRNLTRQTPIGKYKVLYVAAATFLASCVISPTDKLFTKIENKVIPLKAFLAESKTYFFETENEMEAHYLCAILNSKLVDDWIKPFQNTGQWGERDIHKRPLMLPIPQFDAQNKTHMAIAKLGQKCRETVFENLDKIQSRSIGKDRTTVRQMLSSEMEEINTLAKKIIPIPK